MLLMYVHFDFLTNDESKFQDNGDCLHSSGYGYGTKVGMSHQWKFFGDQNDAYEVDTFERVPLGVAKADSTVPVLHVFQH